MMKGLKETLKWVLSILEKHKVPYQITGGLAARIYGSKRKLIDIDIAIPKKYFQKIYPDVKEFTEVEPTQIDGKQWKAYYMRLNYKGQIIEIDSFNTTIFDKKTKKWRKIGYNSKKFEIKQMSNARKIMQQRNLKVSINCHYAYSLIAVKCSKTILINFI